MTDPAPLSAERRALLERELTRRRLRRNTASATIPRRPSGEPPPLSLAQQRLWLLDRMQPGGATYNATLTMRFLGELDAAALRAALNTVLDRHESLRTVGVDQDGRPVGRLLTGPAPWREVDLAGRTEDLDTMLAADAREPFDLSADVMIRGRLYHLSAVEHVFIMVLHHIASDGWSIGLLFSELSTAYNAQLAGVPPQLPTLPIQYGDFARWQHEQIANGGLEADIGFWRRELAGADLVLDLPTDFPRSKQATFEGGRVGFDGAEGSADALRIVARAEGATYFMALMAATGVVLHALTGQREVLLGSPVANRQRPELEGLIGFFVNTVVLRVSMTGNPTFRELLKRCRERAIACLAHQDMPFDRLVEVINPKRQPGRNPLFQVNYRMQGVAAPPPQLTGSVTQRMHTQTGSARFDLAFGFVDGPGALRGYIEYNSALFRLTTAEAWGRALVELVDVATGRPDLPLEQLATQTRSRIDQIRTSLEADASRSNGGPRRGIGRRR